MSKRSRVRTPPGDLHGSFCCGKSSDNLFWTYHDLKHIASMQNLECKTFYVNRSSGPCDILIKSSSSFFKKLCLTACRDKKYIDDFFPVPILFTFYVRVKRTYFFFHMEHLGKYHNYIFS